MLKMTRILSSIISLGLLLGFSQIAVASETSEASRQFRRIEQPLPLKVGVTLGGLSLIGIEMWWFLLSKTKAKKAKESQGVQEVEIIVDGGYNPDRIVVRPGQTVKLNFLRKDASSCLEKVLLPDFHKAADLQMNKTTSVEFTPDKPGEYTFHCGMNMFRGMVEVKE